MTMTTELARPLAVGSNAGLGVPCPERADNPWGLTRMEARVMDAICEHGCHKLAARALHRSVKTVELHAWHAGQKMGQKTGLAKYLAWDRWSRA